MHKYLTVGLLVLFAFSSLKAQKTEIHSAAQETATKANQVTVDVTVTDDKGRYIGGLKKNNFTVFDKGVMREITAFDTTGEPLSMGILFDASGSQKKPEDALRVRDALLKLMRQSVRGSEFFIIAFSNKTSLINDWTREAKTFENAVDRLKQLEPHGQTALYDACYEGIAKLKQGAHRKKALLIISDGLDNVSIHKHGEIQSLIAQSNLLLYALFDAEQPSLIDPGISHLNEVGAKILDEFAKSTGGVVFFPSKDADAGIIFDIISLELKNQYSISFIPTDAAATENKFHRVKVKVERPPHSKISLRVRYREGYMAAS